MSWVVVDDHSSDNTFSKISHFSKIFNIIPLAYKSPGTLIAGGAYSTWTYGVEYALEGAPYKYSHIMKLDADVVLSPDYFSRIFSTSCDLRGIIGGTPIGLQKEQKYHVPGPVKIYSIEAYRQLKCLPRAIGFDVMDEVVCQDIGLPVVVVENAHFSMTRDIGASEGRIHGRFRNGRVCKWTGYAPEYFFLHFVRYLFRKPYIIGALAMFVGWATSSSGPYPTRLRNLHCRQQRKKLLLLVKNPFSFIFNIYLR